MDSFDAKQGEKRPALNSIEEAKVYVDRNGGLYVDPDELVASRSFGRLLEDAAQLDVSDPHREDKPSGD